MFRADRPKNRRAGSDSKKRGEISQPNSRWLSDETPLPRQRTTSTLVESEIPPALPGCRLSPLPTPVPRLPVKHVHKKLTDGSARLFYASAHALSWVHQLHICSRNPVDLSILPTTLSGHREAGRSFPGTKVEVAGPIMQCGSKLPPAVDDPSPNTCVPAQDRRTRWDSGVS